LLAAWDRARGSGQEGSSLSGIFGEQAAPAVDEARIVVGREAFPGLNVIGDWGATTGIAQAARRLTVAMAGAGFDLSLETMRSGAPVDESRVPATIRELPEGRPHSIDLWMLNVNELPVVADDVLRPSGRDSYSVGVWYWELSSFPENLVAQMNRVDEIWVATSFVRDSFRAATRRPVHVVPAIVPDLRGSGRGRADFGLAEDEVVFLFSFDVHSMVARKNPGAVVEAFSRAFPPGAREGVRLVVKVLNLDKHPAVSKWLRDAVAAVDGVVVAGDLTQEELTDLFTSSDVYVSLHRSEGFGFGIAEAMSLGKPVIATAYSGNLDFATPTDSCQVGYRLREITAEDHAYDEGAAAVYLPGSVWAEPDIDQAARWMGMLASDPVLRSRIGEAGRATIRERYGPAAAIEAVERRISDITGRVGIGA
jgi:glycosyltransferase involved in cell wall biosynthesis